MAAYRAGTKEPVVSWEMAAELVRDLWRDVARAVLHDTLTELTHRGTTIDVLTKKAIRYEEQREYNALLVDQRDREIGQLEAALRKVLGILDPGAVLLRPSPHRR